MAIKRRVAVTNLNTGTKLPGGKDKDKKKKSCC
jgi:hypothetical protein